MCGLCVCAVCVWCVCVCVIWVWCVCLVYPQGPPAGAGIPAHAGLCPGPLRRGRLPGVAPGSTRWRAGREAATQPPPHRLPPSAHDLLTWRLFPPPWTESLGLLQVSHSWRSRSRRPPDHLPSSLCSAHQHTPGRRGRDTSEPTSDARKGPLGPLSAPEPRLSREGRRSRLRSGHGASL